MEVSRVLELIDAVLPPLDQNLLEGLPLCVVHPPNTEQRPARARGSYENKIFTEFLTCFPRQNTMLILVTVCLCEGGWDSGKYGSNGVSNKTKTKKNPSSSTPQEDVVLHTAFEHPSHKMAALLWMTASSHVPFLFRQEEGVIEATRRARLKKNIT